MLDFTTPDQLRRLNVMTKYPSIPTYHAMGDKGRLTDKVQVDFAGAEVLQTEKVDGSNARIVALPDGRQLIGSREEWLTCVGDLIHNPAQGIVDAVREVALRYRSDHLHVLYGEAFGGKIGASSKRYGGPELTGFVVFDSWGMPWEKAALILHQEPDQIAAWRDHGEQPFATRDRLVELSAALGVKTTPEVGLGCPPTDLRATYEWLKRVAPAQSLAKLTPGAEGRSEGVVIRTADRSRIAKLRFEDYERTLR